MTRINCIPPAELHNKHLLIEYRELPRVFGLAVPMKGLPDSYRMGEGHVKFFYNKLEYLVKRQADIIAELKKRGYNITHTAEGLRALNPFNVLYNDWQPTDKDMQINRDRLNVSSLRSATITTKY